MVVVDQLLRQTFSVYRGEYPHALTDSTDVQTGFLGWYGTFH